MTKRAWKGAEIKTLLGEFGEPVCPDCGKEMTTDRVKLIFVRDEFIASIKATCPGCNEVIHFDTQMQSATEWKRGIKCAG